MGKTAAAAATATSARSLTAADNKELLPLLASLSSSSLLGSDNDDASSPTALATSVESIITQSKKLRTKVSELGRTVKTNPDLRALTSVQVDVHALKVPLSKLAKNANQHTDVKIRAGGEEHRLRDAEVKNIDGEDQLTWKRDRERALDKEGEILIVLFARAND